MSITLVTGIPGGGKSYWAVHALMFGGICQKYVVFHNLAGLRDEYVDSEYVRAWPTLCDEKEPGDFFNRETQEKLCKQVRDKYDRPVLMIIDEAGGILGKENPEWFRWLSWHRHLGQDVWILVQDSSMIARAYRKLAEIEVRGVKNNILDTFLYSHRAGKQEFRLQKLKKNPAVFAAYDSFIQAGVKKARSWYVPGMIGAVAASVCLMVYALAWGVPNMFPKSPKIEPITQTVAPQRSAEGPTRAKKPKQKPDPFSGFTLAGILGKRVLLQDRTGAISPAEDVIGQYMVASSSASSAVLVTPDGTFSVGRKVGFVKVKAPGAAGAGGGLLSPAASGDDQAEDKS